jgi:cytochrome d ubiquinol oxidase subunit I
MGDALLWHRLQFAFTILYHYLFPQLTMGLALLIVIMKALALRTGDACWESAARFWIRIFGINFAVGVVTGIPMEFQFGTNWAGFSRYAGAVVGHTLAMEGLFAFFLESSFLSLLVWGGDRLSPRGHFAAALLLFAGSWLSGYFIIATNAFMQHPVGHEVAADGTLRLADFWAFLLNPWAIAQYAHNMIAAVVTASFVVSALGAYYALKGVHGEAARRFLGVGTLAGLASSVLVAFPTGDQQAKLVARHQPVALAAMGGRFESGAMAEIVLIGQPNLKEKRLDNPIVVPGMLSFLAYGTFHGEVAGLDAFPQQDWPDNIELLYYAFHIMAGLGTLFIALMAVAALQQLRGRLHRQRPLLWALLLAFPFPYIATAAGWMTAELGRQPWLVYGLMRTAEGASPNVHSGTVLFTLLGFCGLYTVLGLLFLFLVGREIAHGPKAPGEAAHG